jgi:hypothetical protein
VAKGPVKRLLDLAVKAAREAEAAPLAVRNVTTLQNVRAPNAIDAEHLKGVVAEMKKRGAPTIRVVKVAAPMGGYAALEGSHRLAAAKKLGLKPNFQIVSPKAAIHSSELPADLTDEFWSSAFHDDMRDDSISPQDFVLPGDMLQRYAASNIGLSYSPKDFHIKSAIGNRGTFDPDDPDITKARGGLAVKRKKRRG